MEHTETKSIEELYQQRIAMQDQWRVLSERENILLEKQYPTAAEIKELDQLYPQVMAVIDQMKNLEKDIHETRKFEDEKRPKPTVH